MRDVLAQHIRSTCIGNSTQSLCCFVANHYVLYTVKPDVRLII